MDSEKIDLLPTKLRPQISPKPSKSPRISAVRNNEVPLVVLPNPEKRKFSNESSTQRKGRKSVKEIRNEMELRSITPITSFFKKRSQVLQSKIQGESKYSQSNFDVFDDKK